MIVKIGNNLYETEFTIEDLALFEFHGEWRTATGGASVRLADKINDGARYCKTNRHFTEHHHAGSDRALVEVEPVDYQVQNRR